MDNTINNALESANVAAYQQEKTEKSNVSFASGKRFVQSMRRQGISTEAAVKEIVDNSIDANANNVWVHVWKDHEGMHILIQDDGAGMTPIELERRIAFGESGNEEDSFTRKIGRFGFGLPNAIVSRTKYADIYSAKKGGKYYHTYVDLDELANDPLMRLPLVKEDNPDNDPYLKYRSKLQMLDMGTIIVLKNCDNLDGVKKPETVALRITNDLGSTYRRFIAMGKKLFVNNEPVELEDPLMLMKDHRFRKDLTKGMSDEDMKDPQRGYGELFELDPIAIEDHDTNEVRGYIRVKLSLLPMKDLRRVANQREVGKQYGINLAHQGFYLIRNNRQIAEAQSLGFFEKNPSMNYFRGEIDFDASLDDEFGIQVNKTRFTIRDDIRNKLRPILKPIINSITAKAEKIAKEIDARVVKTDGKAEDMITKSLPWIPKATKEAVPQDTERAVKKLIKDIESNPRLSDEEKEKKKDVVKKLLEDKLVFDEEYTKQGPMFTWEYVGKSWKITINREHPFYDYIWLPMLRDPYYTIIIRALVHAMVSGEQYIDEENKSETRSNMPVTSAEVQNRIMMELRCVFTNPEFIAFANTNMPKSQEANGINGSN